MPSLTAQLLQQPRPRRLPVALGRRHGDPERLARLGERQPAEETKLDQLTPARIERRQPRQHRVQRKHIDIKGRCRPDTVIERDPGPLARSLGHPMRAGAIDQQAPHHLGRHPEELPPVLPHHPALIHEPYVGLVHERRRLQRVPSAFAP
jgi:hypothetical protein